jgi:hypothetical protein
MALHIVLRDGRHLITPNHFTEGIIDIVALFNRLDRAEDGFVRSACPAPAAC